MIQVNSRLPLRRKIAELYIKNERRAPEMYVRKGNLCVGRIFVRNSQNVKAKVNVIMLCKCFG